MIGTKTSASIGLLTALMVLASGDLVLSDELMGQASIVDGDTLEIHGGARSSLGDRRAGKYSTVPRRRQQFVSVWCKGRERS